MVHPLLWRADTPSTPRRHRVDNPSSPRQHPVARGLRQAVPSVFQPGNDLGDDVLGLIESKLTGGGTGMATTAEFSA